MRSNVHWHVHKSSLPAAKTNNNKNHRTRVGVVFGYHCTQKGALHARHTEYWKGENDCMRIENTLYTDIWLCNCKRKHISGSIFTFIWPHPLLLKHSSRAQCMFWVLERRVLGLKTGHEGFSRLLNSCVRLAILREIKRKRMPPLKSNDVPRPRAVHAMPSHFGPTHPSLFRPLLWAYPTVWC